MINFNVTKFGEQSNPPLVFFHGFMGSSDDWLEIVSHLSDEYYCLLFDLPGHGKTVATSDDDYKMENCTSQLIEWFNKNLKRKFNLCGYSMGGRLALYMAVNYPENIVKAIVESASPGLKTDEERENRIQIDQLRAKRLLIEPFDQFLDDWYELPLFGNMNKVSSEYKNMINRRLKNDPKLLAKSLIYLSTGNQPSLWDKLDKFESQLLLIVGEKDNKFKQIANDISKLCNNAQVCVIPDAGHTVHLDKKDLYIDEIISFLKK